eukprot:294386-Pyramimonas_sp.AAC.1
MVDVVKHEAASTEGAEQVDLASIATRILGPLSLILSTGPSQEIPHQPLGKLCLGGCRRIVLGLGSTVLRFGLFLLGGGRPEGGGVRGQWNGAAEMPRRFNKCANIVGKINGQAAAIALNDIIIKCRKRCNITELAATRLTDLKKGLSTNAVEMIDHIVNTKCTVSPGSEISKTANDISTNSHYLNQLATCCDDEEERKVFIQTAAISKHLSKIGSSTRFINILDKAPLDKTPTKKSSSDL